MLVRSLWVRFGWSSARIRPADRTAPEVGGQSFGSDVGCYTERILLRVTTPIPTRFSDDELALLDGLVAEGIGDTRSAVVRRAVAHLADAVRRSRVGASIAESYRQHPQTQDDDELAMASAMALTEAEPW